MIALERVRCSDEKVRIRLGQMIVEASRRNGRWIGVAEDLVSMDVCGEGFGDDEYEAMAAAIHDAKKKAKRILRSLRHETAVAILAGEREVPAVVAEQAGLR